MSRNIGQAAEDRVLTYLQKAGLRLLARNFYTKYTELDLVMADKDVIVGVEVKYRSTSDYGRAIERVSQNKIRRLRRGLTEFLLRSGYNPNNTPQRLDVVSVDADKIEWLPNIID